MRTYAQRYRLFNPGETVVVGVSGGPDSLCLLHLLRRLAPELRLWLHVAHLHHGLRGAEADADAAFVAELADCWGLPCTVGRIDVAALAREAGLSLEEAARQARYRFLAEVAEAGGASTLSVGHNADDQAETVLMHFLRGSGAAGLRGMLPRTPLDDYRLFPAEDGDLGDSLSLSGPRVAVSPRLHLVRPLLAIPRTDIESYCAEYRLAPRFDRSNEDTTFFRNRLRHELLPILAAVAPSLGVPAQLLLIPCALAASFAFMMPVGTPPNAIVFASGAIPMTVMVRIGIIMNVIGVLLVALIMYLLAIPAFNITLSQLPAWIGR